MAGQKSEPRVVGVGGDKTLNQGEGTRVVVERMRRNQKRIRGSFTLQERFRLFLREHVTLGAICEAHVLHEHRGIIWETLVSGREGLVCLVGSIERHLCARFYQRYCDILLRQRLEGGELCENTLWPRPLQGTRSRGKGVGVRRRAPV